LPVNENDTTGEIPQNDVGRKTVVEVVAPAKLPAALRKVLDSEDQYHGWRDSLIYFNRNTRLFIVPVKHDSNVSIYGLDEKGNPVTFSEVTRGKKNAD
jgi:hypothetical protein